MSLEVIWSSPVGDQAFHLAQEFISCPVWSGVISRYFVSVTLVCFGPYRPGAHTLVCSGTDCLTVFFAGIFCHRQALF